MPETPHANDAAHTDDAAHTKHAKHTDAALAQPAEIRILTDAELEAVAGGARLSWNTEGQTEGQRERVRSDRDQGLSHAGSGEG